MLPLREQDLQLIDPKMIDGLKSNDKYFPEEDPVRQALRERSEMEDSAPSDQTWHYDRWHMRHDKMIVEASQPEEPKKNIKTKKIMDISVDRST